MELVVGVNSYVSVEEADSYVAETYLPSEAEALAWEKCSTYDKAILLLRAMKVIEALPFVGRRTSVHQSLCFPRYPDTHVPRAVEAAQVEEAVALASPDYAEILASKREMRNRGVTSYRLGKLSETFAGQDALQELSPVAAQLLRRYLCGGYDIR